MKVALVIGLLAALSRMVVAAEQADDTDQLQPLLAGAQKAQARSDFALAADYYSQAVKIHPEAAELWANLGLMDHQTGKYAEALGSFRKARRLKASLFVPNLFMGIDYLELKRAEEAIPFLIEAEKLNPSDPQAPMALGRAYTMRGQSNRASDAYARAVVLAPNNASAWFGLGMANLQQVESDARLLTSTYKKSGYAKVLGGESFAEQGKLSQAADAYKSGLAAPSLPPCAHAGYGMVLLRRHAVSEAQEEFSLELKTDPGCALARLGLAAFLVEQGTPADALRQLRVIWGADHGFLRENLPLFREGVSSGHAEELQRIGLERQAAGDIPSDLSDLLQAGLQADATTSEIVPVLTGKVGGAEQAAEPRNAKAPGELYTAGRYRECSDRLRPHLKVLPEKSQMILAACAFFTGDYRTASMAGRRLSANPGTRPIGLYWEIKADQRLAIAALTRAGEIDANSPRMHVLLGDTYRQRRRYADAEQEYQKALALRADDPGALLGLAISLYAEGKLDDAFSAGQAALRKSPDDPQVTILIAEVLVNQHQYAEAEPYLQRSLSAKGELLARGHALLGTVYAASGRTREAITELTLGLDRDDNGSLHYQLARQYLKIGDKKAAAEAMRISAERRKEGLARASIAITEPSPADNDLQ